MRYTFTEFVGFVESYSDMVRKGHADRDLTKDEAADVAHLLDATLENLRQQEPEGVDPRRVAMTHARQLGTAEGLPFKSIDRAVDILSNL